VEPLHLGSIDVLAALIKGAVNFGFSDQIFFYPLWDPTLFPEIKWVACTEGHIGAVPVPLRDS